MPPGKSDLAIYQGDDFALDATFTTGGAPIDLTGHVFAAEIRAAPADSAPEVLATITCTLVDAAAGKLRLTLDHADTLALDVTNAVWDVQGTDPTGWVTTYLAGKVSITKEVTR